MVLPSANWHLAFAGGLARLLLSCCANAAIAKTVRIATPINALRMSRSFECGDIIRDTQRALQFGGHRSTADAMELLCSRGIVLKRYAVTYFPASITRAAICRRSATVFTGSCLPRRRRIAICVRR